MLPIRKPGEGGAKKLHGGKKTSKEGVKRTLTWPVQVYEALKLEIISEKQFVREDKSGRKKHNGGGNRFHIPDQNGLIGRTGGGKEGIQVGGQKRSARKRGPERVQPNLGKMVNTSGEKNLGKRKKVTRAQLHFEKT